MRRYANFSNFAVIMDNKVNTVIEGLNSEQKDAVMCVEGPVLIVAGAGSGKTRVLTSRIAYILEQGCEAERILALTFTKKAAGEMKERIAAMVGERKARRLCMGTFHSVFIRFLREYSDSLGYPQNFTIYDTSDSVSAIKACVKELNLDDKLYKPKEMLGRISREKNNLVSPEEYKADPNKMMDDVHHKKPKFVDIYARYVGKCKQSGVMDFDDILLNMDRLLKENREALENISGRFMYILVDEYQDTNLAQYVILKRLCVRHHNICVVGDDSQSIYAFRGAKVENILNFRKDYPECRTFRLERNYRSTSVIVNAANSVIEKNTRRIPKDCYSVGEAGEKIRILSSYSEQEEAVQITSGILDRMRDERAQYQDFAILYRTNSQSRALEEALRKRNVPYMIYSGNSFFERAEVKDMMAYFKLVVNPNDDESFKRVVNKPARGIGDTSLDALSEAARAGSTTLFQTVFSDSLAEHGMKAPAVAKLRTFCAMIEKLAAKVASEDALKLAQEIGDVSGLYAFFKMDNSIEGQSRASNIEELMNSVATFVEDRQNEAIAEYESPEGGYDSDSDYSVPTIHLDEFLEGISLLSNVDLADEEDTNNKVALMTVHSAKGLEFPYVFISGLEENLFPSGDFMVSPSEIEEERRLFYVALTRAKKAVTLSYSHSRMRNGSKNDCSPSRFLREIDAEYLVNPLFGGAGTAVNPSRYGASSPAYSQRNMYGKSSPAYSQRGTGTSRPSSYGQRPSSPSAQRPSQSYSRPSQSYSRPSPSVSQPARPAARPASGTTATRYNEATFIPSPIRDFSIGQRIEHIHFGPGRILDITGTFPDLKSKIAFDDYPEPKTILLKYAKMRPEKK